MRFYIGCIFCLNFLGVFAQNNSKAVFASQKQANLKTIEAPQKVDASDGLHDRYVFVHWEASENANKYKVFRGDKQKGGTLQDISQNWQQGTWFCDYTAVQGVEYYYSVMASNGQINSKISINDKGFVKKKDVAEGTDNRLSSNENKPIYSDPRLVPLQISTVTTDKLTYKVGETAIVSTQLKNILETNSSRTEVRYFISKDAIFDWDDKNIGFKTISSVQAEASLNMKESIVIPNQLVDTECYIIVVSSAEGRVIESQILPFKITVIR